MLTYFIYWCARNTIRFRERCFGNAGQTFPHRDTGEEWGERKGGGKRENDE